MPNELIHLRIGPWILHPDAMVLPIAGIFFAVLAYGAIRTRLGFTSRQAFMFVAVCCLGGVLGARLYGTVGSFYAHMPVVSDGAWKELRFGSMGGIWGILAAASVYALFQRRSALPSLDAMASAICISAAVARVSCIFQGCCVGNWTGPIADFANPIYTWPLLDLGALLVTLCCIRAARHRIALTGASPGVETITFLIVYGFLRFGAESLRDTYTLAAGLTWGQSLALAQVVAGTLLVLYKILSNDGVPYTADASDTSPTAIRELA